jgi:hypothetical protein
MERDFEAALVARQVIERAIAGLQLPRAEGRDAESLGTAGAQKKTRSAWQGLNGPYLNNLGS